MINEKLCREHFGRRVKYYRINQRMRQEDLAAASGFKKGHIAAIETGFCNPSFNFIVTIASTLQTTPWKLFRPYKNNRPKIVRRVKLIDGQSPATVRYR